MFNNCCSCLETIKVLAIAFTKSVLKAFRVNFCKLSFEVISIIQLVITIYFIKIFKWIWVRLLFLDFFVFCAIQCVGDTAFARQLGDHLWWYVVPGVTDPSADLVKPNLANATPGSKAVLSSQHQVLPLCPHAVLEGLVNGHIQRLKHSSLIG